MTGAAPGVTASEIAVILGLSPCHSSPFELYYRKRGELPGQRPDNDAMAIGRAMENFVADQFRAQDIRSST